MNLAEFLLVRIAEDEAVARGAGGGHDRWTGHVMDDVAGRTIYDDQWTVATVTCYEHDEPYSNRPDAVGPEYRNQAGDATSLHIARHDPARVLAECEAKRRIIECHHPVVVDTAGGMEYRCTSCIWPDADGGDPGPWDDRQIGPWPCPTLCLLALPYADHPDYRDEWRP